MKILIGMCLTLFVCLVFASSCVRCRNGLSDAADTIHYVCTGDTQLNKWDFSPQPFDWGCTGPTYSVIFSPLRPRAHRVFIDFDKGQLNARQVGDLVKSARIKLSIFHIGNDAQELYKMECIDRFEIWGVPGHKNRSEKIRMEIKEFSPACCPWPYKDKIMVCVELLGGVDASLIPVDSLKNGRLVVSEFYPLY